MTRPRKQTVEWFPHSVEHGMTVFILEERYGIAGYYFWFRLLELLGQTEGHFIDYENSARKAFLQAKTKTSPETCLEILDLLAELEAIDQSLWKEKIIWSDNFVEGVAPVYQNRRVETPSRPDNYRKKSHAEGVSTCSLPVDNPEPTNNLPVDYTEETAEEEKRREGREEKEEKQKEYSQPGSPPAPPAIPPFSHQDLAQLWNEKAPVELSRVTLPFSRKERDMKKIRDALKRHPEKEWWERVILILYNLPFVRGDNDRGWKITLDVMVRDAELILDGKYAGKAPGRTDRNKEVARRFMQKG